MEEKPVEFWFYYVKIESVIKTLSRDILGTNSISPLGPRSYQSCPMFSGMWKTGEPHTQVMVRISTIISSLLSPIALEGKQMLPTKRPSSSSGHGEHFRHVAVSPLLLFFICFNFGGHEWVSSLGSHGISMGMKQEVIPCLLSTKHPSIKRVNKRKAWGTNSGALFLCQPHLQWRPKDLGWTSHL